jgi:hypothetical protein
MEVVITSETSVTIFPSSRRHIPESLHLHFAAGLRTDDALSYNYDEVMGILCMTGFWDVTPCVLLVRRQGFGGNYCLQLQDSRVSSVHDIGKDRK